MYKHLSSFPPISTPWPLLPPRLLFIVAVLRQSIAAPDAVSTLCFRCDQLSRHLSTASVYADSEAVACTLLALPSTSHRDLHGLQFYISAIPLFCHAAALALGLCSDSSMHTMAHALQYQQHCTCICALSCRHAGESSRRNSIESSSSIGLCSTPSTSGSPSSPIERDIDIPILNAPGSAR
ncbi:hypothetical protein C8R43DRAFT_1113772 [Mycena crocata]|nr:hypothetical protein C8R43DRAFT_1113772 [Mycena crocata]